MLFDFKIRKTPRLILALGAWCGVVLILSSHQKVDLPEKYVLKFPSNFGGRFTIPEDNPTTIPGVELGRFLFYEPRLSIDNTLSCASCHQQQYAFTDRKAFSSGVDGGVTSRNSMSLVNLLWVRNFFWDGRVEGLEQQAVVPMSDPHEMGQSPEIAAKKIQNTGLYPPMFFATFGTDRITGDLITKALSQFERTLISSNSKYDQYLAGSYKPTESEANGMKLFLNNPDPEKGIRAANCDHCHGTPKTFKELFHNNGLDMVPTDNGREKITGSPVDKGRFRVPTLRNIALTAPYMHDGRFATLEEVVDHYSDHIAESETLSSFIKGVSNQKNGKTLNLTAGEKNDLVSFLHMLTDSSFINNPKFSNPHITHE